MGGMAAQIPIKNDEEANNIALAKVRADKEREAKGWTRWNLGCTSRVSANCHGWNLINTCQHLTKLIKT